MNQKAGSSGGDYGTTSELSSRERSGDSDRVAFRPWFDGLAVLDERLPPDLDECLLEGNFIARDLLRFCWPVLQVCCAPPVGKNPPLSARIFEHKRPRTVLFKSPVLVYATPRGGKHEKDPVTR